MNDSGCKNCPVKNCDTMTYCGSRCAALREQAGAKGDPMTVADHIRRLSDEDLAVFLHAWSIEATNNVIKIFAEETGTEFVELPFSEKHILRIFSELLMPYKE